MEYPDKFIELVKQKIDNCYDVIEIKPGAHTGNYFVSYISIHSYDEKHPPTFEREFKIMELKSEMRDSRIDQILNSEYSDNSIENKIYTPDQLEKLHKLRNVKNIGTRLNVVLKEYSESFSVGDKIWYRQQPGFITFKHVDKDEEIPTRWSVKVNNTEFRYVSGMDIVIRKVSDISEVPIDPELNKLSTRKLLLMYKKNMKKNKGKGNLRIKRILKDREHIQNGPNVVKVLTRNNLS